MLLIKEVMLRTPADVRAHIVDVAEMAVDAGIGVDLEEKVELHGQMTMKDLQDLQREWCGRNFPRQLYGVSAEDVAAAVDESASECWEDQIARAINDGTLAKHDHHGLVGVAEEVGELCHAFLKLQQGIRGSRWEHEAAMQDAVGDVVIFLASFCNTMGIDMQYCVEKAWAEVSKRDWRSNPTTGEGGADERTVSEDGPDAGGPPDSGIRAYRGEDQEILGEDG